MRQRIFSPKEAIVRRSEMMYGIFFLCRGLAQVMDERGLNTVKRIEEGGHFQEGKLFDKEQPSTKTVVATSYCEVYVLNNSDYTIICDTNDEFRAVHASLLRKEETRKRADKKAKKFFGTEDFGGKKAVGRCGHMMLPGSKFRRTWDISCALALLMYVT